MSGKNAAELENPHATWPVNAELKVRGKKLLACLHRLKSPGSDNLAAAGRKWREVSTTKEDTAQVREHPEMSETSILDNYISKWGKRLAKSYAFFVVVVVSPHTGMPHCALTSQRRRRYRGAWSL